MVFQGLKDAQTWDSQGIMLGPPDGNSVLHLALTHGEPCPRLSGSLWEAPHTLHAYWFPKSLLWGSELIHVLVLRALPDWCHREGVLGRQKDLPCSTCCFIFNYKVPSLSCVGTILVEMTYRRIKRQCWSENLVPFLTFSETIKETSSTKSPM